MIIQGLRYRENFPHGITFIFGMSRPEVVFACLPGLQTDADIPG